MPEPESVAERRSVSRCFLGELRMAIVEVGAAAVFTDTGRNATVGSQMTA